MPVPAGPMPKVRSWRGCCRGTGAGWRRGRGCRRAACARTTLAAAPRRSPATGKPSSWTHEVHALAATWPRSADSSNMRASTRVRAVDDCRRPEHLQRCPRRRTSTPRRSSTWRRFCSSGPQVAEPRVVGGLERQLARRRPAARHAMLALTAPASRPRSELGSASVITTSANRPIERGRCRRNSPSGCSRCGPASCRGVLLRRPLDQHALHGAHHARG